MRRLVLQCLSSAVLLMLAITVCSPRRAEAQLLLTPANPVVPAAATYAFSFLGANVTALVDVPGISLSGQFNISGVSQSGTSPAVVSFNIGFGEYTANNYGTVCTGTFSGIGSSSSETATVPPTDGPYPIGLMTWNLNTPNCFPGSPTKLTLSYVLSGTGNLLNVTTAGLVPTIVPAASLFGLGYSSPTTLTFMDVDLNVISGIGTATQYGNGLASVGAPID
jgi:hypothetical protein